MIVHHLMKWAAALLLIGVAAGGAGLGIRARSEPPRPEPTAPVVAGDNRYRVTLAGDTTFEVAGISGYWSNMEWWRPDGTLLVKPLADPSGDAYSVKPGENILTVLVRVENLPKDATLKWVPTYDWTCLRYLGGDDRSGPGVNKDGQKDPELRACVASFRPNRMDFSVRIQFAAGPWKTMASDGGRARFGGGVVNEDGHKFYFGLARPYRVDEGNGTTIAVAHDLVDAEIHNRLVAVDLQGKEHPARYYADAAAKTAHSFVDHLGKEHPASYALEAGPEVLGMLDADFVLPPDQVREFRVQSRPFVRAEIKNIALKPAVAKKP